MGTKGKLTSNFNALLGILSTSIEILKIMSVFCIKLRRYLATYALSMYDMVLSMYHRVLPKI